MFSVPIVNYRFVVLSRQSNPPTHPLLNTRTSTRTQKITILPPPTCTRIGMNNIVEMSHGSVSKAVSSRVLPKRPSPYVHALFRNGPVSRSSKLTCPICCVRSSEKIWHAAGNVSTPPTNWTHAFRSRLRRFFRILFALQPRPRTDAGIRHRDRARRE